MDHSDVRRTADRANDMTVDLNFTYMKGYGKGSSCECDVDETKKLGEKRHQYL